MKKIKNLYYVGQAASNGDIFDNLHDLLQTRYIWGILQQIRTKTLVLPRISGIKI